jgi:hypothetical protein
MDDIRALLTYILPPHRLRDSCERTFDHEYGSSLAITASRRRTVVTLSMGRRAGSLIKWRGKSDPHMRLGIKSKGRVLAIYAGAILASAWPAHHSSSFTIQTSNAMQTT